jgi:uncharacterized membrane protein YgaE (UPF0421/DUF939 family)
MLGRFCGGPVATAGFSLTLDTAICRTVVIQQAVIGYCYQTIILLLADQSPPVSAWTMTTVLQIAVGLVLGMQLTAMLGRENE